MQNSNIIEYVNEFGKLDFDRRPLTNEDALVLCQFSYLKFESILDSLSDVPVSIKEIYNHKNSEALFSDFRYEKPNRLLAAAMAESQRFSEVKACFFIDRVETETQFSAITYILPDHSVLIVFRGTDENIVGWQEDLRLALNKPVLGQTLSVKYINDISKRFYGNFYIAGHSKGGNLAIYSAMLASGNTIERINKIIVFDSPGFRDDLLKENHYEKISKKVEKLIPKSSVVGMLLDSGESSTVVDCHTIAGVTQHNPYNWLIKDGKFVEKHLKEGHKVLIESINQWILSKDEENLERFVALLSEMIDSSEANTTTEFSKDFIKNATAVAKATGELNDETKSFLIDFVKSYFIIAGDLLKEEVKDRTEKLIRK